MQLDITSLVRATGRLEEGLERYRRKTNDAQIRDGLIQRFEFTYDLAPKMLRRALEAAADTPVTIDQLSFPAVIRTGFERGLLEQGWPTWDGFRKMRNITSHTYNEVRAKEVVEMIPAFLEEVRYLVARLDNGAPE